MLTSRLLKTTWPPTACLVLGLLLSYALGWTPFTFALGLAFAGFMYCGIFRDVGRLKEPVTMLSLAVLLIACWAYGPLDYADFVFFIYLVPAPFAYARRSLLGRVASGIALVLSVQIALRGQPRMEILGHTAALITVIFAWIVSGETIARLERERDRFRHASLTDPLTGLWTFNETMNLTEQALQVKRDLTVMLIDMDGFKQFNDTFGHLAGNRVLTQFARALKEEAAKLSRGSIVGRLGGDEFVAVIPGLTGLKADEARKRFAGALAQRMFTPDPDFAPLELRFSVGLATSSEAIPASAELLVHLADVDMYREKYGSPEPVHTPELDESDLPVEYQRYLRHLAETDIYTYAHSRHASQTAMELAVELGLPDEDVKALGVAGWLHDIGKILIPTSILRKPASLLPEEFNVVKAHVQDTLSLVDHLGLPPKVIAAIRSHHERWDGWGYPFHLVGNQTPIEGRILQVADAFSAMTLKRVYRERTTIQDAVAEISRNAGSQFDPHVARVFAQMSERRSQATRFMPEESRL
ncbi:MAG: HD domain-containing phosphohydrolase [Bacillota bacterium]